MLFTRSHAWLLGTTWVLQIAHKHVRYFQLMLKLVFWIAADSSDVKDFRAKHGRDLYMTDIDEYDRICKVSMRWHVTEQCQCNPCESMCLAGSHAVHFRCVHMQACVCQPCYTCNKISCMICAGQHACTLVMVDRPMPCQKLAQCLSSELLAAEDGSNASRLQLQGIKMCTAVMISCSSRVANTLVSNAAGWTVQQGAAKLAMWCHDQWETKGPRLWACPHWPVRGG